MMMMAIYAGHHTNDHSNCIYEIAGVRAVSLCLRAVRGSRTKWRSGLGFDDGASFMEYYYLLLII